MTVESLWAEVEVPEEPRSGGTYRSASLPYHVFLDINDMSLISCLLGQVSRQDHQPDVQRAGVHHPGLSPIPAITQ